MPVTTTAGQVFEMAYAKSRRNKAGEFLVEATEGIGFVNRSLAALYAVAARLNPFYFATQDDVPFDAGGWARPTRAESIFRLEHDGDEVVVVPFDQRGAEPSEKCVYRLGQVFFPAGNANDPTSGELRFFFSAHPVHVEEPTDTVDPLWNENYNELLALEVAIYLAVKDGRADEVPSLVAQRDRWLALLLAHMEHETVNERRAYGHVRRVVSNTVIPISALLAGGTTLQLGGAA